MEPETGERVQASVVNRPERLSPPYRVGVNGGNAGAYTKTGDHLRRPLQCLRIGPCLQCRSASFPLETKPAAKAEQISDDGLPGLVRDRIDGRRLEEWGIKPVI